MLTKVIGSALLFAGVAAGALLLIVAALAVLFAFGWFLAVITGCMAILAVAVARDAWRRLAADWRYWRVLE